MFRHSSQKLQFLVAGCLWIRSGTMPVKCYVTRTLRHLPDELWLYIARGCDGPESCAMASTGQRSEWSLNSSIVNVQKKDNMA